MLVPKKKKGNLYLIVSFAFLEGLSDALVGWQGMSIHLYPTWRTKDLSCNK